MYYYCYDYDDDFGQKKIHYSAQHILDLLGVNDYCNGYDNSYLYSDCIDNIWYWFILEYIELSPHACLHD